MAEADIAEAEILTDPRDRSWHDICELGLQTYANDLDTKGYCVIPPEIANPNPSDLPQRMAEALLNIAERRNGERPNVETGETHANRPPLKHGFDGAKFSGKKSGKETPAPAVLDQEAVDSPFGDGMALIFSEDEVFAEAVMNPVLQAMVTHLVGYSAVLSSMGCWMKGPCRTNFQLHSDNALPNPLPETAYQAQCTYVLTDFDRENGATCIVPGSHKWLRRPTGNEGDLALYEEGGKDQAVVIDAPAGSLIVWHGNTWHGAFNRKAPGLRLSVTVYFVRDFIRPLEDYIDNVPQEWLDKYGPRFAMRLQQGSVPGAKTQAKRVADSERADKFKAAYEKSIGVGIGERTNPHH